MRAGGEGVIVAIDVRDTDIEEEIYQKGTNALRQKNLRSIYVFKDHMFDTVRITFCKSISLLPTSIPVAGQGLSNTWSSRSQQEDSAVHHHLSVLFLLKTANAELDLPQLVLKFWVSIGFGLAASKQLSTDSTRLAF